MRSSALTAPALLVALALISGARPAAAASLLLSMQGSGASFSDTSGSVPPHAIVASGGATQTTHAQRAGGVASFDGTGDYLSVADSDDWSFGAGAFTIEFWVYAQSTKHEVVAAQWATGGNNFEFDVGATSAGRLRAYFRGDTTRFVDGATDLRDGWHHVAFVRSGDTLGLYVDGALDGASATLALAPGESGFNAGGPVQIGRYDATATFDYTGFLDDFRITKGAALYTGTFTPPADLGSVPEPATAGLLLAAAGLLVGRRRART